MAKKITDEVMKFTIVVNGNKAQKEYDNLRAANQKLASATENLEQKAAKLRKGNKANTEEYKKLQAEIQKNNTQITENDKRMSELTKEIGLTNLTMKQLNKEARKLNAVMSNLDPETQEWQEYNKQLVAVKSRQAELRKEMRPVKQSINEQKESVNNLSYGFSQLFAGLRSGSYQEASAGINTIKGSIKGATKAALAFIATPIGLAITALVGIGAAAKSWFDYNSQVVEALRLTEQITGLSDQAADQARIRAEALRKEFGVDFKETLEVASGLSKEFGVSISTAFDEIEESLVRGQKNNKEYFESLDEYDTFLAQAGFSIKDFRRLVETGYDLKFYKDKLPDAFKEATIEISTESDALKKVLSDTLGKDFSDRIFRDFKNGTLTIKDVLGEINKEVENQKLNQTELAKITEKLFISAGQDAGGALKVFEAYNIAINQNQRELTESEKITQQQVKATTQLKQISSALFTTGDKGFGLLIDKAKLFGTKMLIDILKAGVGVYNWFVDLNNESTAFATILTTIGEVATFPFRVIGKLVSNAINQFKNFGDIIEGVFTLDFEKIKSGFKQSFSDVTDTIKQIKDEAVSSGEAIYDAFSGKTKVERVNVDSFLNQDTTENDVVNTTTDVVTSEGDDENELTPEDKRRLESRKRLYEQLKQFEEEQAIQEELNKIEKDERAEEEEIIRKELQFEKLITEAEGDRELQDSLEEQKQFQLQQIRDKYGEIRAKKQLDLDKKLAAADKKLKDDFIKAEMRFQQAKANALNFGIKTLQDVFGKQTAIGKAAFLFEKGKAIAQIVKSTAMANAAAKSAETAVPTFLPVTGLPNPTKPISVATTLKNIAANKINAAVQIATIVGTAIKGFEEGLYPVTRKQDGKKFTAKSIISNKTQIVNDPAILVGEKPEMVIDPVTFKQMDPKIVDYILQLAGKRPMEGFEKGLLPKTNKPTPTIDESLTDQEPQETTNTNAMLVDAITNLPQNIKEGLNITINFTLDDVERLRDLEQKLTNTENASKN